MNGLAGGLKRTRGGGIRQIGNRPALSNVLPRRAESIVTPLFERNTRCLRQGAYKKRVVIIPASCDTSGASFLSSVRRYKICGSSALMGALPIRL